LRIESADLFEDVPTEDELDIVTNVIDHLEKLREPEEPDPGRLLVDKGPQEIERLNEILLRKHIILFLDHR
jgi:hypothetical protein